MTTKTTMKRKNWMAGAAVLAVATVFTFQLYVNWRYKRLATHYRELSRTQADTIVKQKQLIKLHESLGEKKDLLIDKYRERVRRLQLKVRIMEGEQVEAWEF